jgi:hypothetical protein
MQREILWICALAIGLHASPAAALNKHFLSATVPGDGQSTLDKTVSHVDALQDILIPSETTRFFSASVDSANGALVVGGLKFNAPGGQSRATGRLDQRMYFDAVPIVIQTTLLIDGGAGASAAEAHLEVGGCPANFIKSGDAFVFTGGCQDSTFVTWVVSGGDGALHITATWVKLPPFGELDIGASLWGELSGANGEFSLSGHLTVETQLASSTFESDSFLTEVPEPDSAAGLVAALGTIAVLTARRAPTAVG